MPDPPPLLLLLLLPKSLAAPGRFQPLLELLSGTTVRLLEPWKLKPPGGAKGSPPVPGAAGTLLPPELEPEPGS